MSCCPCALPVLLPIGMHMSAYPGSLPICTGAAARSCPSSLPVSLRPYHTTFRRSNLPRLPDEKSDSPPCTAYDPHVVSAPGGATAEFRYGLGVGCPSVCVSKIKQLHKCGDADDVKCVRCGLRTHDCVVALAPLCCGTKFTTTSAQVRHCPTAGVWQRTAGPRELRPAACTGVPVPGWCSVQVCGRALLCVQLHVHTLNP